MAIYLDKPQQFDGRIIRVRARYRTDFEESTLSLTACPTPFSRTWVDFESRWETRKGWRLRHAVNTLKWRIEPEVVFVGRFTTAGRYGYMDVYAYQLELYKVEEVTKEPSR